MKACSKLTFSRAGGIALAPAMYLGERSPNACLAIDYGPGMRLAQAGREPNRGVVNGSFGPPTDNLVFDAAK
jgi:hypothetical protein